ncbi:hypothetical protein [Aquidulcibacter sp.]|uniref:hypothetical protein n=1 Tax=Aquidulcibacter sp. TaxID=2052990 RepID=UPI0025C4080A|nr:hypothetical protein [Aquidulcibacter sp.]MCA3064994.1 hypothetical protein [Rhodocyclaceae bacterium]MCA3694256.1 hypothetical protein [Aquidulcibacter sp.]
MDEQIESPEKQEEKLDVSVIKDTLAKNLCEKFKNYETDKLTLENRWLENLRAYNNKYDADTEQRLAQKKGASKVYIGLTRKYTEGFASRLAAAAMPTDGKNWSFTHSAIPQVAEMAGKSETLGLTQEGAEVTADDLAKATKEVAAEASKRMERVVEDQMAECDFNAEQRYIIDDAALYGIGILEAPIVKKVAKVSYKQEEVAEVNEAGEQTGNVKKVYQVEEKSETRVSVERCSPWDFYWDQTVERPDQLPDWFRVYRLNAKELRDLAKQDGMDQAVFEEVLEKEGARRASATTNWQEQMRAIVGASSSVAPYLVKKYVGPIGKDELLACGCPTELEKELCIVWLINDKVAKIEPLLVKAGWHLNVSVFAPFPDGVGLCGYGVPDLCSDPARAVNAVARAILDHSREAAIPMRIINTGLIKGVDGTNDCYPGKDWESTEDIPGQDLSKALINVVTPVNLQAFYSAYEMFYRLMDDVTMLPQMSQGFESFSPTTAREATIRANAANETLRRILKRYEDNVMDPVITRFYHWNMQYNEDESIKGDFEVVTSGVAALMEAESQGQWYTQMLGYVINPQTAGYFKARKFLEGMAKGQRINPEDVLADEADVKKWQESMAQQQSQAAPDPRLEIAKMNNETKAKEIESRERIAASRDELLKMVSEAEYALQLQSMESTDKTAVMGLQTRLAELRQKLDNDNRKHAIELQVEAPNPRLA